MWQRATKCIITVINDGGKCHYIQKDHRQIVVKCLFNVTLFRGIDKYEWSMQTCVIKFCYREKFYITTRIIIRMCYEFLFISFVKISISISRNISTTRLSHCVIDNHNNSAARYNVYYQWVDLSRNSPLRVSWLID